MPERVSSSRNIPSRRPQSPGARSVSGDCRTARPVWKLSAIFQMPIAFPCFCTRTRGRQPHSEGHRLTQPRCAACLMTPGISATCGNGIRRSSHRAPEPSIPRYHVTASARPQAVPWFRSAVFLNFPSTACRIPSVRALTVREEPLRARGPSTTGTTAALLCARWLVFTASQIGSV